jgi:hypothetical protein
LFPEPREPSHIRAAYTLAGEESGTSVKAAGWRPERVTRAEGWSRDGRERGDNHPTGRKVRWGRWLAEVTEGLPLFEEA